MNGERSSLVIKEVSTPKRLYSAHATIFRPSHRPLKATWTERMSVGLCKRTFEPVNCVILTVNQVKGDTEETWLATRVACGRMESYTTLLTTMCRVKVSCPLLSDIKGELSEATCA